MKAVTLTFVFFGVAGCLPESTPPKRVYPPADCNASCENQRVLKCDWYVPTCIDDCTKTNEQLISLGSAPMNTGCSAGAKTCAEILQCRGGE